MRLWVKSPLAILATGAEGGVVVEGSRIVELIAAGQAPSLPVDEVFDASRHVVIPGLINTHHHFFQTLARAHPAGINKELFPWLQGLYPIWQFLEPDMLRIGVRLALTELLMSGCTTAMDHHYMFPPGLEDAVDIEVDEALKLGIRATMTRGSISMGEDDGRTPPRRTVQDEDVILEDSVRLLEKYHDTSDGAMTQIALAPCAPFIVSKRLMTETAALADKYDCRLHTHLAETMDEEHWCLENFGMRPVDWLEDVGWLQPRVWLAHGIHFSDEECKRLGHHGVGVCHCPTSNAVLASGFCKTRELEAAGAPVGLGVDGSASNDASNLMEEVRHAVMVNRLHYRDADRTTHLDALRWATEGSAKLLGRDDIGKIAVGKQADLAMFTLDELRFSGSHDPIAALVLCGANRADRVMVAGKWRIIDGVPPGMDLDALMAAHSEAARKFAI